MVRVHWFTASIPADTPAAVRRALDAFQPGATRDAATFMQRHHSETLDGVAVHWGNNAQPIVINAPGQVCDGLDVAKLAARVSDLGGWLTRIDLARDVDPPEKATDRLLAMDAAIRSDDLTGPFKPEVCNLTVPSKGKAGKNGHTLYVGSTGSDCYLLVYDRRGPLRMEFRKRFKGRRTRSLSRSWLQGLAGDLGWPAAAHAGLLGRYRWSAEWFTRLQGDPLCMSTADDGPSALAEAGRIFMEQQGVKAKMLLALGAIEIEDLQGPLPPLTFRQQQQFNRWKRDADSPVQETRQARAAPAREDLGPRREPVLDHPLSV
jgi:hypothetical protein